MRPQYTIDEVSINTPDATIMLASVEGVYIDPHNTSTCAIVWASGKCRTLLSFSLLDDEGRSSTWEEDAAAAREAFVACSEAVRAFRMGERKKM